MTGRWYWSAILDRADLSDAAVHTYLFLCRFEKNGVCNPSLQKLADAMVTDRSRVAQSMKELEAAGAIRRDRGDPTGWASTTYTLLVWATTTVPVTTERRESRLSGVEWDTTSDPVSGVENGLSGVENGPKWCREDPQVVSRTPLSGVAVDTQTTGTTKGKQREQLSPTVSATSNGSASRGEERQTLDAIIEAVRRDRRPLPLSRDQAREALKIARDRLQAGWSPEQITRALTETTAFTTAAVDFAASPKRGTPSAAERSQEVLERRIRGER